ncbi:YdhK family protein (plasmid) [Priestia megaterium]|uniref:YdhK family protein n=1 Tax=Priestia megaterium TaxID=1404 RepID=UPI001EDB35DC|nr:YdhK family protein [Priestia megaterium]UKJ83959.1 YdhK family protein [Priestia megaterium]
MKKQLFILGVATIIGLSGCGNNSNGSDSDTKKESNQSEMDHSNMNKSEMDHSEMNHSTSGEVPEGLQEAKNPKYEVGSQAVINADHMEGMDGAKATIVGAYDTTVYTVSYTPTTGGEKVTNHKWVIQEELKDADGKTFKAGDEVTLEADHMEGMKGAKATIDSAEKTTVYMVDYTPTTGGEKVKNHKWVTESELSAK